MNIRGQMEEWENNNLSPYATKSVESKGRLKGPLYKDNDIRTSFQRDRDRIIHSKSFRRLKHKTQVFISPEGDHYRTRLTHTLEVSQIARTVARALRLNEDLTEAIALGHDLGHTPFGHAGEEALNNVFVPGFKHNEQSLRVVDQLDNGKGMNLTWEVRDGILNHTGPHLPATLEGQIVKIADRIAYVNHDVDDAVRAGIIQIQDIPKDILKILGEKHKSRINTMVVDMIQNSFDQPQIMMSNEIWQGITALREYLFKNVYVGSSAKTEEYKAKRMLQQIYQYYVENYNDLPNENSQLIKEVGVERVVCDYVAGMTDRYAITIYNKIFVPTEFTL
jgi:dGTPase